MKLSQVKTLVILIVILVFFGVLFGASGFRSALAVLLFFEVPFYLILRRWFNEDEAIFYSFFVGIGLFSAFVYYIGFFTGIAIAIWITFVILTAAGLMRTVKHNNQEQNLQSQDFVKHEENLDQGQEPSDS